MAQGFKNKAPKLSGNKTKSNTQSVQKRDAQLKKGARVIKPKNTSAVQARVLQKKLTSEHIRNAEQQTAGKVHKPTGSNKLTLIHQ